MSNNFNNNILNYNKRNYNLNDLLSNNNQNIGNNKVTQNNIGTMSADDFNSQFAQNTNDEVSELINRMNLSQDDKAQALEQISQETKANKEKYAQELPKDSEELKRKNKIEDFYEQQKISAVYRSQTIFELEKELKKIEEGKARLYAESEKKQKEILNEWEEREKKIEASNKLRETRAYIDTAVYSFGAGMLEPVEAIIDGFVIIGSSLTSGVVSIFDEKAAADIKQGASDFISADMTGMLYDEAVKGIPTEIAYGKVHGTFQTFGTMFGYVALTFVGGGLASSFGTSAGMSTASIQTMSMLTNGTVSAFAAAGSSGETALNNGASFDDAAKTSMVSFGAGFVAGGALDKIGIAAKGASSLKQVAGYTMLGGTAAASEPVVNSVAEYSIYADEMTDENGNKLYDNFLDYYKKSGGLLNTAMAFGIGSFSTGAQGVSGYRANKVNNRNFDELNTVNLDNSKNSSAYVDNMATEKLIDFDDSSITVDLFATEKLGVVTERLDFGDTVDLLVTEKLVDGTEITSKLMDGTEVTAKLVATEKLLKNVDLFATEHLTRKAPLDTTIVSEFENVMYTGVTSDTNLINLAKRNFKKALEEGNEDAMAIINKLIKLKKTNPKFHMVLSSDATSCYWMKDASELVMGSRQVMWDDFGTFNHEMGHGLFDMILDGQLPENWDKIAAKARMNSTYSADLQKLQSDFEFYRNDSIILSRKDLESQFAQMGTSLSDWKKQLTKTYDDLLSLRKDQIFELLTQHDFPSEVIDDVLDGNLTAKDLAVTKINQEIIENAEKFDRTLYGNNGAISDMLDALYEGNGVNLIGDTLPSTYSHGKNYYESRSLNSPFHETIANFTQIKMSGSQTALDNIKSIFGEEYYNFLEEIFSKFKQ